MTEISPSAAECLSRVRAILQSSRRQALQTVNAAMVQAYWQIGREIVEEEQRGQDRAAYGARLIEHLSAVLTKEYGRGFNTRSLWYMKDVYLAFPKLGSPIVNAVRSESQDLLSWTHYRLLSRVSKPKARDFYAAEGCEQRAETHALKGTAIRRRRQGPPLRGAMSSC